MRAESFFKETAGWLLCAAGIDRLFRAINRDKILILAYHGISEASRDPHCPWIINETDFTRQVEWLARHYQVRRIEDVVARMRTGRPVPDRVAVLTFDDGYRSMKRLALPVLRHLNIPATVFLTTSALNSPELLWHDRLYLALAHCHAPELDLGEHGGEQYVLGTRELTDKALHSILAFLKTLHPTEKADVLTSILCKLESGAEKRTIADQADFSLLAADEVGEITESGLVDIGAHSFHHEILTRLDRGSQLQEIQESAVRLRNLTGVQSIPFAYPNGQAGDFDDSLKAILQSSGFSCGATAIHDLNESAGDLFELRRIVIEPGLSMGRFRLRTSGFTKWLQVNLILRIGECGQWLRASRRPLRAWVREFLFKRQTVLIFEREPAFLDAAGKTSVALGKVSFAKASFPDLNAFAMRLESREQRVFLENAESRIHQEKQCFAVKLRDQIVSYIWADRGPSVYIEEAESTIDIGPAALYLFDAFTVPEWRGRNLFPYLLSRVCTAYPDTRMVVAALSGNRPSLRGIAKAGFRTVNEHYLLKIGGIRLQARSQDASSRSFQ
jgi:peptidoglycan/xylan/chitin deacetylase (PgdA/CDA1 family)